MKNTIYWLTIAIASLTLTSCEWSFLDNDVYSSVTRDNFYKTKSDYEKALVGCYYYIAGRGPAKEGSYAMGLTIAGQAGTDETWGNAAKGDEWDFVAQLDQYHSLRSDNLVCQEIWINHYSGINSTMEISDRVFAMSEEFLDANPIYKRIAGEACYLQALWYFNLVRIYGGVPIKPKASRPEDDLINVKRNSIEQVYAHIIKLLDYAKQNTPTSVTEYGRATKNAAYALSAKVNLHIASSMNLLSIPVEVRLSGINSYDWTLPEMSKNETIKKYYTNARDDAKVVLDYFAPNYLVDNFQDCFFPNESSKEILFEGIFSNGLAIEQGGWFGSIYGPTGKNPYGGAQNILYGNSALSMSQYTFYNIGNLPLRNDPQNPTKITGLSDAEWVSTDKRFNATWACFQANSLPITIVAPLKVYVQSTIGKFRPASPNPSNQDRIPVNNPILRTSDICLIYAEAQAELDNMDGLGITNEALYFLNVVRIRAGIEPYSQNTIVKKVALSAYPATANASVNIPNQTYTDLPQGARTDTRVRGNFEIPGWTDYVTPIVQFRRAILNERTLELIGEGHRWFDLVRMGVLLKIIPSVTEYSNNAINNINEKQKLWPRDMQQYHIFRPLPSRELAIHGPIMLQNYGYYR